MKKETRRQAVLISELAMRSMLYEVSCSPSPGLVSPFDSGAHWDMDYYTYLKSIPALFSCIEECAEVGLAAKSADSMLARLRVIGKKGEKRMFRVTGGINTQKGQVFLHGIIAAAAAYLLRQNSLTALKICQTVSVICRDLVSCDFADIDKKKLLTRGEQLYLEHGMAGIRGEAERGLPSVIDNGLPALLKARQAGLNENDIAVHVLLTVMCCCEDSNIAGKHSVAVLREVQDKSRQIMRMGGMLTTHGRDQILALHKNLSIRRISPGGAADLMAATFFIIFLEEEFSGINHQTATSTKIGV